MKMSPWAISQMTIEDRLAMNTVVDSTTGCHIFHGRKDSKGYGQIKIKGKHTLVHRWLWQSNNYAIDKSQHVLHKCDTPACINLEHLFLGNHDANMQDKAFKGRAAKKLTDDDVIQIKRLISYHLADTEIAKPFNVDRKTIGHIRHGKTWGHIQC